MLTEQIKKYDNAWDALRESLIEMFTTLQASNVEFELTYPYKVMTCRVISADKEWLTVKDVNTGEEHDITWTDFQICPVYKRNNGVYEFVVNEI